MTESLMSRLSTFSKVVLNLAAALGIVCVLITIVALVWGVRPLVFSTNSMAPTIPAGSLALTIPVDASQITPTDIISANRPGDGKLVTHRVVSVENKKSIATITMRGDANNSDDSTPYNVSNGAQKVIWHLPHAGGVVSVLQSPWIVGGAVTLVVIALIPGSRTRHVETSAFKTPSAEEL